MIMKPEEAERFLDLLEKFVDVKIKAFANGDSASYIGQRKSLRLDLLEILIHPMKVFRGKREHH